MPRTPAKPGAKRQTDTPLAISTSSATAPGDAVVVLGLPPDAHDKPVCANVVLWSKSGRFTAGLLHANRVVPLQADIDEFGEPFVANHLNQCTPHAHWFLVPVHGIGSTAAEAVTSLRARVSPMLRSKSRSERGSMELLAASFASTEWSEGL